MFKLIENLRTKPESTKKQVAFLVALSFSGLIFVIWLSVIYPEWRKGEKKEEKVVSSEPHPLAGFMANLSTGIGGMKEQFSEIKKSISFFDDMNAVGATSTSLNSTTTISQ